MNVYEKLKYQMKNTKAAFSSRASSFRRDEDGSMLIFAMFILVMMLLAGGLAVDAMRTEYTRTTIQNTLDRAVLAAADLDQTEDAKAVVLDYFAKAGLSSYISADDIKINETKASGEFSFRRVSATARADVNTIFLPMLGIKSLAAVGAGAAEEGITDLEISLVVDVSGSMGWDSSTGKSKIYELRKAAKDFSFYMQCNPKAKRSDYPDNASCTVEEGKVSITLVPYAEQVTVGKTLLDQFKVTDEHEDSHCVTFDPDDFVYPDIPLDIELLRTGHFDPWSDANESPRSRTCRTDSWREIRPFVAKHTDMETYINALSAGGNTSIDVGMKWGLGLLDPAFRIGLTNLTTTNTPDGGTFVDTKFVGRPYSYTQDYSMKVIVLMTDGVNTDQHYLNEGFRSGPSEVFRNTADSNRYSVYNPATDKYYHTHNNTWNDHPYGDGDDVEVEYCKKSWWYGTRCWTETQSEPGSAVQMTFQEVFEKFPTSWYNQFSWLETAESNYGNTDKNARLSEACTAAKSNGVIVYTIGFETDPNDSVMSGCASSPSHFFPATGSDLAEIFGTIASSINQLRLTQ
ncbi:TadE/TadG family type IV pilus assembly protein [Actibacterium lipolyticum]|uniref:Putative Flp pilus-assembly TadG-like N-terminal domain-containing protein n=1 Tax=Actibacterium lipolyticum TaxID=1524263 RepID=A0A238JS33_9RHOB|nr:Tad domain-containing protein [Actibacterium lipolyticum]SMX33385.1 hypothetical protein COL8621_01013 [Actibacterium lipolyticum]